MKPKYKRILLKISGGALSEDGDIFNKTLLMQVASNIINAHNLGIQIAIVVGGGNIFRGRTADDWNIDRVEADNIGMLATIINSLILKNVLISQTSDDIRLMTAIPMHSIAEPYIRLKAKKYLDKNYIVIFGGGTGQPFTSTDYPSIERAIEVGSDIVLMAKDNVSGVYDSNHKELLTVNRYKTLNYSDAIKLGLKVVDQSAFVLAQEFNMPMYVFNLKEKDSIARICFSNEQIGTFLSNSCKTEFY